MQGTQPQTEKKMPFATIRVEPESLFLRETLTLQPAISIFPELNPKHEPPPKTHSQLSCPGKALHCFQIVPYHLTGLNSDPRHGSGPTWFQIPDLRKPQFWDTELIQDYLTRYVLGNDAISNDQIK